MEMENFTEWIKRLAIYLGNFKSERIECVMFSETVIVDSVAKYDQCILGYDSMHSLNHYFIFVANNKKTLSKNPYIKTIAENIFPAFSFIEAPYFDWHWMYCREEPRPRNPVENKWMLPYNSNADDFYKDNLDKCNELSQLPVTWRADIRYPAQHESKIFSNVLNQIVVQSSEDWWSEAKYYNVFWNLFALTMYDDIYNESTSCVMELAQYLGFTEPMLHDWCRAVEYVMNGNQLSEGCDLQCETVEGRRFFLHKNE